MNKLNILIGTAILLIGTIFIMLNIIEVEREESNRLFHELEKCIDSNDSLEFEIVKVNNFYSMDVWE